MFSNDELPASRTFGSIAGSAVCSAPALHGEQQKRESGSKGFI
jgi:hypothetical protein